MAKTPLVYTHKGNRTTIAITASSDRWILRLQARCVL